MLAREPFSRASEEGDERRLPIVYARKTDIRFPPSLRADVTGAARGLAPIVFALI